MLIDKKNVYQNSIQQFPESLIAGFFGYPRIDLDKYGIVTSTETQTAFETKKADPIKLR